MIPALLGLVLTGCADLSNAAFTEDATYLAPLPSAERFASPWAEDELPTDGGALMPPLARDAGSELDLLLDPLVAAGEAIRSLPPDERTAVSRSWSDVLVASPGAEVEVFHARAEVVQTWEGLVEWTLETQTSEGEWLAVATGRGYADGSGELEWDLARTRAVTDTVEGMQVQASWREDAEGRWVRVTLDALRLESPHEWLLAGEHALLFTGSFPLQDEAALGVAGVAHLPGVGGRARVETYPDADTVLTGGECWDADGVPLWLGGDGFEPAGDEALCPIEPFEW